MIRQRLSLSPVITQDDCLRLLEVVRQLSYVHTMGEVTAIVRRAVRDLTGADGATFVLRENDVVHYVDEDAIGPLWKGQRFPIRCCVSGLAILERSTMAIPDIYQDARVPHAAYRPTFVRSLVMVPIRREDPVGAIGTYWAEVHRASDREIELVEAVADAAAIAFENAVLFDRLGAELDRRTRAEAEVRTLNAELEKKVEDRTRRLSDVCSELDRFAHTVSHDLKAPLRTIRGFTDIVLEDFKDALPSGAVDPLRKVREGAERMGHLIEGILAYARLSQTELQPEAVELDPVLDDVLERLGSEIRRTGADVAVEKPLPRVLGHRLAITQVVENLITNAVKFVAPALRPNVRVRAEAREGRAVLWVEDNGIGIPKEDQARIFRGFERLHPQSEYPGSGVGLSIVRRAVERMGGRTGVESEPGRGSRFFVELPVA